MTSTSRSATNGNSSLGECRLPIWSARRKRPDPLAPSPSTRVPRAALSQVREGEGFRGISTSITAQAPFEEETFMAKSVEQTVAELADRDAIRELPQRYCDCVWRGDIAGVVDLFTDDGAFIVSGGGRDRSARGRTELLKTYGTDLT